MEETLKLWVDGITVDDDIIIENINAFKLKKIKIGKSDDYDIIIELTGIFNDDFENVNRFIQALNLYNFDESGIGRIRKSSSPLFVYKQQSIGAYQLKKNEKDMLKSFIEYVSESLKKESSYIKVAIEQYCEALNYHITADERIGKIELIIKALLLEEGETEYKHRLSQRVAYLSTYFDSDLSNLSKTKAVIVYETVHDLLDRKEVTYDYDYLIEILRKILLLVWGLEKDKATLLKEIDYAIIDTNSHDTLLGEIRELDLIKVTKHNTFFKREKK